MPSADQVPVKSTHSTMRWPKWVVLIAGSTGSALRAVRPPNRSHHAAWRDGTLVPVEKPSTASSADSCTVAKANSHLRHHRTWASIGSGLGGRVNAEARRQSFTRAPAKAEIGCAGHSPHSRRVRPEAARPHGLSARSGSHSPRPLESGPTTMPAASARRANIMSAQT
jgi:hypothetical protein